MAATPALLASSKSSSELVQAFDLFHANRALWLQIEADKRRIRDADKTALVQFETGQKRPGFTLFRKLPSDLRSEIWCLAAMESRVVEVIVIDTGKTVWVRQLFRFASNTLPAMLHVCFEARKVGLKLYTQINRYARERDDTTIIGRTFVNFNTDIILLETVDTVKRFSNSADAVLQGKNIVTDNCKHLAVVDGEAKTLPERLKSPLKLKFDELQTLYVVDKYTYMGASKTGNLTFVDTPEGSREQ
ncbi:hypothetical protein DL98DRAFT_640537 [Cadophora sp. DSE1049]|nr:hypothetical protein DL98DRAFT_640537 [Cadophora sp. DSE1049]